MISTDYDQHLPDTWIMRAFRDDLLLLLRLNLDLSYIQYFEIVKLWCKFFDRYDSFLAWKVPRELCTLVDTYTKLAWKYFFDEGFESFGIKKKYTIKITKEFRDLPKLVQDLVIWIILQSEIMDTVAL